MYLCMCLFIYLSVCFRENNTYNRFILGSPSSSRVESYFFHSFKQAITLIHGSTKYFNDMPIEKQRQLWAAASIGERKQSKCVYAPFVFVCTVCMFEQFYWSIYVRTYVPDSNK